MKEESRFWGTLSGFGPAESAPVGSEVQQVPIKRSTNGHPFVIQLTRFPQCSLFQWILLSYFVLSGRAAALSGSSEIRWII